jgi:phenylalanyl-tRNA synthetase beta chain
MLFSYKELGRLVDLSNFDVDTLVNRLTFSGFEVEGVEPLAQADKLVIGQVLTCEPHPDSDHLHILTVDCGSQGILDIVCGAKNVRKGLKVIVALVGCSLPAIHETIKAGVIRGKQSNGMCCSLLELGVNKDSLSENSPSLDGIEELDDSALVGDTQVLSYLGLDDTILDINVLPNRPDCLSYVGMAREISSLTGALLKEIPSLDLSKYPSHIHVESRTDACVRFDGLKIENIVLKKETPLSIQRVLMASGIRSIDPIVDLGNYVMLLSGQPFNMYDADKNPSDTYIAVDDYDGEFVCFDGKKLSLKKGDLLIKNDKDELLCLAGVMAGEKASITSETRNIFIEVADFYHANIRHTCNRLGLSSFSSQLYSKGRNPKMISEAISLLISSLDEFLESYKITSYSSFCKADLSKKSFHFSYDALNKRLGSSYSKEEIDAVLKAYRVEKGEGDLLIAPIDRVDLNEQCDIDEEVFRFYPASKITPSFDHFPLSKGGLSESQKMKRDLRYLLVDRGFDEILSFTLISEKEDKSIRVFSDEDSYRILNPMTKDHEIVRSDLLPSMISTMQYNIAHQNTNLRLFEISDIDTPKGNKVYLSIGLAGETSLCEKFSSRSFDFFDLKGTVEAIFHKIGLSDTRYRLAYSTNSAFHPKASADIFLGKDKVGTFGQLHPLFCKEKLFVAELDLGYLMNLKGLKTKFNAFSSYPMVRRDISFKVNDKVTYALLRKTILSLKNSNVRKVEFFDDFVDKITMDHYIGVSLLLGKEDGTLNESEINSSLDAIKSCVRSNLGLTLRGE